MEWQTKHSGFEIEFEEKIKEKNKSNMKSNANKQRERKRVRKKMCWTTEKLKRQIALKAMQKNY